ncbi:MAG: hypothetical protein IPJ61_20630 [Tessaracoccus sp.]|uniref:hypothetical protein n=1 Tax=Tessaracoccus sp. TaxID=1971211 RepID=UPI001EC1CFCF|nr:hypothetical protein [Tessaracoccus sp.]MBK7823395.1 hypothetical protein [Tessaracoccus sp.]
MSEAIDKAREAIERDPGAQWFAPMVLEAAERVEQLLGIVNLMSRWEVEYVAVKDARNPVIDPRQLAREIAGFMPKAKVRKLKARRAEPVRQVAHVPGWGTIDVYQAAGEMQKLVRDIGIVRDERDAAEQKVQQLTNDLLSSPSHAELGRLRSELKHRYTELERLRVAVRDALKGDQQ